MDQEIFIRLIMSFVFTVWFGYYAFLAWLRPHRFQKMAEKSLFFYGNASLMKDWIHSQLFLWLARVGAIFFTIVSGIELVTSVWSLI